jgi:hypothetical protein
LSMNRIAVLIASAFITSSALAGGTGGGGIDNYFAAPVAINPNSQSAAANQQALGLSQTAAQTFTSGLVLITAGQSNIANEAPSVYSPTNATHIFQLNIFDGKIYPAVDPLLGATNVFGFGTNFGNPSLRIADGIITAGYFSNVLLVPVAVSGSAIAWWVPGFVGANLPTLGQVLPVAVARIKEKGITCGSGVSCVIAWGHGEEDNALATTQLSYTTSGTAMISAVATAGFVGHWYIAKQTWYTCACVSAAVQAAQAALVNGTSVFAGPNADALTGNACGSPATSACRQADNVHWTDNGSLSYAAAWVTALHTGGF